MSTSTALEMTQGLVSVTAGAISATTQLKRRSGANTLHIVGSDLGDLAAAFPGIARATRGASTREGMNGAGSGFDLSHAELIAVVEGAERYASCVWHDDQFIWATAHELGDKAIPYADFPKGSAREYGSQQCPIVPFDPDVPIRWVRGVVMTDGRPVWIPAMMAYMFLDLAVPAERFWTPISTGCAAHTDADAALLNGLLEVIERDAIAIVWNQQLPLQPLSDADLGEVGADWIAANKRHGIDTRLYSAGLDLPVPIVYGLELAPSDSVAQMVACAAACDPVEAVEKCLRELTSIRIALSDAPKRPDDVAEFRDVTDGSTWMAAPERREAFEFLLTEDEVAPPLPTVSGADAGERMRALVDDLESRGHSTYAIELTTRELRQVGLRAFRVLVPSLQPLSFSPLAQYRGHPRMNDALISTRFEAKPESELNPWPQPFA